MRRILLARVAFAAFAALAAPLLSPSTASAFERQWHAGLGVGYSYFSSGEESLHGVTGSLHLTYGMTDALNAMVVLDTGYHPAGDALIFGGAAGVGYVVDILQVVPYVGLMVGPYDVWRVGGACDVPEAPACHSARLSASIPFGLDYTVSRSFAVGIGGRYHLMFFGPNPMDQMITAFARAELTWGY
jgi:hypothetical protein